jgi:ankyrin repeat protein
VVDEQIELEGIVPDADDCTALHRAACEDRADDVARLLAAGAPIEARDNIHHSTPLEWAAYYGSVAAAAQLLAAGASRAHRNSYGLTPLEIAEGGARGEHPEAAHRTPADFAALIALLQGSAAGKDE